jgi:RNA polymerase sigma-70 factor, ECF subfamily
MNTAFCNDEFEIIVAQYQPKLHGFVRRFAGNREDAEEIVQDTFMRAYRALSAMSRKERRGLHLRAWLYTIARNTALNFIRKKTPPCVSMIGIEAAERQLLHLIEYETPEAIAIERASLEKIERTLRQLPNHLREVARLRFIEDQSETQIARASGRPIGTVKSQLRRALIAMRRARDREAA